MAICLSMLTSLESLNLDFGRIESHPDLKSRHPFPPIRRVLPALAIFRFVGVNEYLEEFVARIDAPQLRRWSTTFITDIGFNTPELNRFISRTPILGVYDDAIIVHVRGRAIFRLRQSHPEEMDIVSIEPHQKFASLVHACTSLRLLLTIENLYIIMGPKLPLIRND
jgi:hypothetical protein